MTDPFEEKYLGFNPPTEDYAWISRDYNFNPVAVGRPFIQIKTRFAVIDSTNDEYDLFPLVFLNNAGDPLAEIIFNNATLEIERGDGVLIVETGVPLTPGSYRELDIIVDFAANRWSATWGGVQLFTNAPFSVSGDARNFGYFDFAWDLVNSASPGDNYLHVNNFSAASFKVHPALIPGIHATIANLDRQLKKAKKIKDKKKKKKKIRKLRARKAYQSSLL